MKVIICGGGQVGTNIARYLASESNAVTVIDQRAELTQKLADTLDVQTVVGHATSPPILERAGAADADMIIAVTQTDEVNMTACQVAHSLFSVPTKIARIRNQAFLDPIWADLFSSDNMPIDVIISPEVEVARAISRRLAVPGAFEMIPMADNLVRILGVRCDPDCPIVNTPLRQLTTLFPELDIEILAIVREGRLIIPSSDDQMFVGDEVYFVAATDHVPRAMTAFGHEEPEARRVLIIGGGKIGLTLAQDIEETFTGVSARVIEHNPSQARAIAEELSKTIVLAGDALDPEILIEANAQLAEVVIAVTNNDEVNILASLLAKRHGAQRAVTLINKNTYNPLMGNLGIDAVVNPRSITASTILQHVRQGRIRSVHSLGDGFAEIIEAEALQTSSLINKPIKDVKLPSEVIIGAIIRGDEVQIARPSSIIKPHDRVVLIAAAPAVKAVEKFFAVRLEFF